MYTKTIYVGFVNLCAHMPVLDYQDIIQAKGLPCYEGLLRHKQEHPASSLDRIWLEATGLETLDHFLSHVRPSSSESLNDVADVAPEPANPVQEVECTRTQSSDQASISSGMFLMLPRRMSLFAASGICVEHTTSMPTTILEQDPSEDGIQMACTEPIIHIARGLFVKDDYDDDDTDDVTPPSPNYWMYATRIHHHEMFCCCLLCMAMNT